MIYLMRLTAKTTAADYYYTLPDGRRTQIPYPDVTHSLIPAHCLTIGQVLGATLQDTVDGFTPLTPERVVRGQATTIVPGETATPTVPIPRQAGRLVRKHIPIDQVTMGPETQIAGRTLYIRDSLCQDAVHGEALVTVMSLDIITPDRYSEYSHTIMDVQPIAVKEHGDLGEGVTRVLDGVVVVITGAEASGVQVGEFGASAGKMEHTIRWGRPGAPDRGDILIKTQITLQDGTHMQRPGPLAAHRATDILTQEIRAAMQKVGAASITSTETMLHLRPPDQKKVAVVKEIMGQGAMHDNLVMPHEPVGSTGAQASFDLGNVPIVVSPLHVLDGCIHAFTCVGPASKLQQLVAITMPGTIVPLPYTYVPRAEDARSEHGELRPYDSDH